MNDPIIHAKASKIVEVISNEGIIEDCCNNAIGSSIAYNRITEALASLASSERDVLEGFKKYYDENSGGNHINPWLITSYLAEKGGEG